MLIPDPLAAVYLGAFLVGVLLTLVAFLAGTHGLSGDGAALHGHPGDLTHAAGHAGHDQAGPSPFNLQVLAAFVTFFGGVGYALSLLGQIWGPLIFLLALVAGLLAASAIFWFLARVLYAGQTPVLRERDYFLPGTIARVSSPIREGGVGEIVFEKGGRQRVEGARLVGAGALPRGAEVVIVRYERGIAYVEPLEEFMK
ncbi:MAG: hypothetical protein KatS3mg061_1499 [Dehalococcoidia bacterium]|nr:MAG: hypothetical protein KatS3mg061_1499 [Dehalococcoidia bacterium]